MALIRYVSLSGANGAAVLSDLAVPLRETKPVSTAMSHLDAPSTRQRQTEKLVDR